MAKARKSSKRKLVGRKRVSSSQQTKPKSEFLQFFERVVGKSTSLEKKIAFQAFERFKVDLEQPSTSLERLGLVWNTIAPHYLQLISPIRLASEIRVLKKHASFSKNDRIASLGSGPAVLESFLAKQVVPSGFVSCVDISPKMNEIAKQTREREQA